MAFQQRILLTDNQQRFMLTDNPHILSQMRNVKVLCKPYADYALGIKDGGLKLVCNNPRDLNQFWAADKLAFVLVNMATVQALCLPLAPGQQMLLVPHKFGTFDHGLLWSECGNTTDEFRAISVANYPNFILDADQNGQRITVVEQNESPKESQLWKISPHAVTVNPIDLTLRL